MPQITGLGYTRKDKVFAEFEIDGSFYKFKESHSSKGGIYKVGVYRNGSREYTIEMGREQINRIKNNSGIATINFLSEEGFIDFLNNTYLNRDFNEQNFRANFQERFMERFGFLQGTTYEYIDPKTKQQKFATIDEHIIEYTQYLMGMVPSHHLENLYESNKTEFSKSFKYAPEYFTISEESKRNQKLEGMINSIIASTQNYLNSIGLNYMTLEEFKANVNGKDSTPQ